MRCSLGLGFLTLEDSIDVVLCPGSDAWSYCVAIHSCVVIPHCVGVSSCVSSFASSSRKGAEVERACAAAYIKAKFGYSESANEQSSRAQGGSEPGRRGATRAMTVDQVHAVAVVGERANSAFSLERVCEGTWTPH